jgi:hypothetical protein
MGSYIFIARKDSGVENVVKVEADNISEAKERYAMYLWDYDSYLLDQVINVGYYFWREFLPKYTKADYIKSNDKYKEIFKGNLNEFFTDKVSGELYDVYHHSSDYESQYSLSDEARLEIGLKHIKEKISIGWIEIFSSATIARI